MKKHRKIKGIIKSAATKAISEKEKLFLKNCEELDNKNIKLTEKQLNWLKSINKRKPKKSLFASGFRRKDKHPYYK